MQRALQESLEDYNSRARRQDGRGASSSNVAKRDLESLDAEIEDVQNQITGLQSLLQELRRQREEKLRDIRSAQAKPAWGDADGKSKAGTIDYNGEFEWRRSTRRGRPLRRWRCMKGRCWYSLHRRSHNDRHRELGMVLPRARSPGLPVGSGGNDKRRWCRIVHILSRLLAVSSG